MKTLQKYFGLLVVAAGPFFTLHSLAGGVCRAFTDTQGRTVKGQLMGFDEVRQLVTIQRADNNVTARAQLADFSAPDQQYIQTWDFEREFNHSLRISVSRRVFRNPDSVNGKRYPSECMRNIGYEVQLENQSTTRFEAVEIEYCLFYRQGEHNRRGLLFNEGVQHGRSIIESISPGSSRCLKTDPVLILNETGSVTAFGRSEGARGEVLGLWLRVHATSPYGTVTTREYCSPSTLNNTREWTGNTIGAGLNHQERGIASPKVRLTTPTLPSMGRFTVQ